MKRNEFFFDEKPEWVRREEEAEILRLRRAEDSRHTLGNLFRNLCAGTTPEAAELRELLTR